jgi:hypothetical protein
MASLQRTLAGFARAEAKRIQTQALPRLERLVKSKLKSHLENNKTIQSILGNGGSPFSLKQEFGLTTADATREVANIIDAVVESIKVTFTESRGKVVELGKITISFLPGDSQRNMANRLGMYITDDGKDILWLNWLLTQGSRIIVDGWTVVHSKSPESRAGGALMTEIGNYRVNPEHSGVINDNFITRAIDEILPEIQRDLGSFL